MEVIGLDIGRSSVKLYAGVKLFAFPSVIGEWRERRLTNVHGEHDYEVEFRGQRYFAGTLAQEESEFGRSMMTDDKAHDDTLLLALIALHRANVEDVALVTGLPVKLHEPTDKQRMRDLLFGRWEIVVNRVPRVIKIHRVEVAVEGGGAFWSAPTDGLVRLIDAGSKTINYVTMRDKRYVDRDSGTLPFGFDTNISVDHRQMANKIAGELGKKWSADDNVLTSGGRAEELAELLRPHFPRVESIINPLFANAIGFYRTGKAVIK